MRTRFLRTLAVTAVFQFFVTRALAGQVIEEGRAERMWKLFPVNVLINAAVWTLIITAAGRATRVLHRA
jgi:hypothetical protein